MDIKILLADDHQIVRQGLRALIEQLPQVSIVGEAENGQTTVTLAQKLAPDLVIMDVAMPDLNGIEATRQILELNPRIKVIALSMYSDKHYIVGMIRAGASGYVLKDCAFEELANAIRAVTANRTYLSPGITDMMVQDYVRLFPETEFSVFSILTRRECQVLQFIAEGKTTKEIAFSLQVSVKTIETYRKQIMDKLNLHSIAELTKYAIREGLTTVSA